MLLESFGVKERAALERLQTALSLVARGLAEQGLRLEAGPQLQGAVVLAEHWPELLPFPVCLARGELVPASAHRGPFACASCWTFGASYLRS